MSMKITIRLEENLTDWEQDKLRQLLADAVSEFAAGRYPANEYVARRYAGPGYNWMDRPMKVQEVQDRINLAKKLHGPVLSALTVHPKKRTPEWQHKYEEWCSRKGYDSTDADVSEDFDRIGW